MAFSTKTATLPRPAAFWQMLVCSICILLFTNFSAGAQQLKLYNYGASYRLFEMNSVGNNPLTVGSFLKDPVSYSNYVSNFPFTSITGNPGVQRLHNLYIHAEWKPKTFSRNFWRRHTIQTGLLLSNRRHADVGSLGREEVSFGTDSIVRNVEFRLRRTIQFAGLQLGINRRFSLGKRLNFLAGLHAQGSIAVLHRYTQRFDSSIFNFNGIRTTFGNDLPGLEGKNYFQWQAMVPLGLEYDVLKDKCFVRLDLMFGVVGNRFRPKSFAAREAHGIGLSIMYKPKWSR